nr:unnamed protein product [Rangifer tarandus platyrhynchus]
MLGRADTPLDLGPRPQLGVARTAALCKTVRRRRPTKGGARSSRQGAVLGPADTPSGPAPPRRQRCVRWLSCLGNSGGGSDA